MIWIESTATFFGLLCVWLTVRQNIWCWPTGLLQVVLYIFVFYDAKLYSDLILHIIYVVMQIYGWYHWLRGGSEHSTLKVSSQPVSHTAAWGLLAALGAIVWGYLMASFTDAAVPYWDAFIIATSLIAQWLMARKKIESWFYWITVDVVAIGVYLYKALYITTGLYSVFLFLVISGYFTWRKALIAEGLDESRFNTREIRPASSGSSVGD
jgi:nicotinamide mononucleotide transporter